MFASGSASRVRALCHRYPYIPRGSSPPGLHDPSPLAGGQRRRSIPTGPWVSSRWLPGPSQAAVLPRAAGRVELANGGGRVHCGTLQPCARAPPAKQRRVVVAGPVAVAIRGCHRTAVSTSEPEPRRGGCLTVPFVTTTLHWDKRMNVRRLLSAIVRWGTSLFLQWPLRTCCAMFTRTSR